MSKDTPKRPRGRPLGSKGKLPTDVKQALLEAFRRLNGGDPAGWFLELSEKNPKVFASLLARCIPQEVTATVSVNANLENILVAGRSRVLENKTTETIEHAPAEQHPDNLLPRKMKLAKRKLET